MIMVEVKKIWWDGEKLMAEPIDPTTIYQEPAQPDSTCSNALRAQGKAYPRTCNKCGLGPCVELAQQALDKKAENARELGLDYEPAPQKPIIKSYLKKDNSQPVKWSDYEPVGYFGVNDYGRWEENENEQGQPFYTSPPQRTEQEPAVPDAIHHTDLSETLEYITGWNDCRQAMLAEQPEQEPVAWLHWLHGPVRLFLNKDEAMMELDRLNREYPVDKDARQMKPLYTSPPQRKPLTEEKIDDIWNRHCDEMGYASINDAVEIARDFEAAHGIKGET